MTDLASKFRDLGVSDPETWARAQDALEPEVQAAHTRVAASTARQEDLDLLAKAGLWASMHKVLALLDGATQPERTSGNLEFGLFKLTEDFAPEAMIEGLHESWRDVGSSVLGSRVVQP